MIVEADLLPLISIKNAPPARNLSVEPSVAAPAAAPNVAPTLEVRAGDTVVKSCTYEPPTTVYPRGRVVAVASFGASNPMNPVAHQLEVVFDVVVNDWQTAATFQNQGEAEWSPKGTSTPNKPTNPTTGPSGPTPGPYDPSGVTKPTPPKIPTSMIKPSPIPVDNPLALLILALGMAGLFARQQRRRS